MPLNIPKQDLLKVVSVINENALHSWCPLILSFSNQSRCGPFFLSAAKASGLPAGGRDADSSWTGQEDKAPRLQQPHSAPQPEAPEEDRRQTLNWGWKHPSARQLLDCVASLDRYQAEEAQERGEHGPVLCQLHRKQSSLAEIKLQLLCISFKQDFRPLALYNTAAQCEGCGCFLSLM